MALLEVNNLSYRYPDGLVALDSVSFKLDEGERVGLIGPNGAGKSTLLWHLNGLLPERGYNHRHASNGVAVNVDGMPCADPNLERIRQTVGLVFQDPDDQLFHVTVREDVAFGPVNLGLSRSEIDARVEAALAAVGLQGYEDRSPRRLSIGERKRVCLAGVLACEPRLLALDEPTANLDPRARRQFMHILESTSAAQLIATHDLEMVVALCPRAVLLDGGRVHADGPTEEILRNDALLAEHGLERPLSLR